MTWRPDGPLGFEAQKVLPFIVPYTRGRGLDLGCGAAKAFPHMLGMDGGSVYGPKNVDLIGDITDLSIFADRSLDFVFSSHALEDIEDTQATLREWWRVLRPGTGHLVLYLPHKLFYPNIGQPGANPAHKHDFMPADILALMQRVAASAGDGCTVLEDEERGGGDEYSFLQVYRKDPAERGWAYEPWRRQPNSTLIIRYGGWGDMAPVSSVLPLLKERGRHITLGTTPRALAAIGSNPNIDAYWLQDRDQVPNHHLGDYWARLGTRFDEVINLSASVEDSLLPTAQRVEYHWPLRARQRVLGPVNYYERTHDICGVRHEFRPKFWPRTDEADLAEQRKAEIAKPVVMLVLRGSSVHKIWPYTDEFVAMTLRRTNAHVVLVGDGECTYMEQRWAEEPRVWCRSGVWSIRETLAFAQQCEVVVGPETGVLNFMSAEPTVRKVVLLSHSSHENLTRHWLNTVALVPDVSCGPCHRMHYSFEHCVFNEATAAAACASAIGPDAVFAAIAERGLTGAKEVKAPFFRVVPRVALAKAAEPPDQPRVAAE
jgi:predicted SAM-dependent methyltransferase/ADP-heptose:LPS heptosyltransferase